MSYTKHPDRSARTILAVIIMAAAAVRFYHLETPSLWWDEILVPLTASHGLEYILDFCRSAEMHPPLFYLVSKAALGLGASDFALRLLPALLGLGTIYLVYRVVRALSDTDTGLLAASVLAVNGLHILLSREIRPYTLQMVLLLAAWLLIARLLDRGRWRDLWLLGAVNAALFWLHYFTFHMVFAQGLALAAGVVLRDSRMDFKRLAAFCLATLVAALPVFAWFFLPSTGSRSIFTDTQYSRMDVLRLVGEYLGQALFFFDAPVVRWGAAGLALAGFLRLAARDPRTALICLILLAVPLANVLAMGKAAYFSPWHVAYVTPFLAFFTANALNWLPGRKALAAGIAVCGAVLVLSTQQVRYYEVDSYRHPVFVTLFKPVARILARTLPAGGPVVCSDPGFANGLAWYLDQYSSPNPLRCQALGPAEPEAIVRFVSASGEHGLSGRDAALLASPGAVLGVEKALNAMAYTLRIPRQSVARMDHLPFEATVQAGLAAFYGQVTSLRDVTFCPTPGVGVTPTRPGELGVFEYVLENTAGDAAVRFLVNLQYLNDGRGNLLGLYYRFDDEEKVPLAGTLGPDPKRQAQAMFERHKPFKRLAFTVEMRCADRSAKYHGGNLETLAFRKLEVFACPAGDVEPCRAAWERRNMESMRLNYGSQAFLSKSATAHVPAWATAENLQDVPSPEAKGWNVLGPEDPSLPAVLRVEVEPREGMVFYPRLSGPGDSVLVFETLPDGAERPVFMMTGVPDEWTPISAQYPLILPTGPEKRSLRIELRGRYAQLWHRDGNIFF